MSLLIEIDSCEGCPHFDTRRTLGAGLAIDWLCNANKRVREIRCYIESANEEPKDIPKWCPYRAKKYNKEK